MISSGYIRKMGPKGLTDKLKTRHVRIPAFSCLGACDALSPPPEAFSRWCSARGWLLLTPTGSQRSFPATHFPLTLLTGPCHFPRGTFHGRNGRVLVCFRLVFRHPHWSLGAQEGRDDACLLHCLGLAATPRPGCLANRRHTVTPRSQIPPLRILLAEIYL